MISPSNQVSIGIILSGAIAYAWAVTGAVPTEQRYLDVTEMAIVGQGCGTGEQRQRIYIATEEDQLPGPTCEVVFELVDRG